MGSDKVLIIGAGISGLYAALKLAPLPITLVSTCPLGEGSSSSWAKGGVAAAFGNKDSFTSHLQDTIAAGAGIVHEDVATKVVSRATECVNDLERLGVLFDKDNHGNFDLALEGGHSLPRVVHADGYSTGYAIIKKLIEHVKFQENVEILSEVTILELVFSEGRVIGAWACNNPRIKKRNFQETPTEEEAFFIPATSVIIAGGGIGGLYRFTTNPDDICGRSLGLAARAGCDIVDAEFVQFHPTAMKVDKDPAPLITEAMRGAGASIVNQDGIPLMKGAHDREDLAPRDIVARVISRSLRNGEQVFIDMRKVFSSHLKSNFTNIWHMCYEFGFDPGKDIIPIRPAAHYHMGGIKVDFQGRTSIGGIWACGEIACTGMHGANRLASNSLLEAMVFASNAAEDLKKSRKACSKDFQGLEQGLAKDFPFKGKVNFDDTEVKAINEIVKSLRNTMHEYIGVERCYDGLKGAIFSIVSWEKDVTLLGDFSLLNMIYAAKFIAISALRREESRGSHFRTDYPNPSSDWQKKRVVLNIKQVDKFEFSFMKN